MIANFFRYFDSDNDAKISIKEGMGKKGRGLILDTIDEIEFVENGESFTAEFTVITYSQEVLDAFDKFSSIPNPMYITQDEIAKNALYEILKRNYNKNKK